MTMIPAMVMFLCENMANRLLFLISLSSDFSMSSMIGLPLGCIVGMWF